MSRLLSKDFLSGVMFIAFGLTALWFGRHLAMGTTVRMGPGYVPHMLAYIMMALGGIIVVVALLTPGEITEAPKWKPITMVTIGIVCFALLFESAGLIPALIVLILIASLGGDEFKLTEVLLNMVVLAILCIIVFKVGLSMNISVIRGVW
ncbi:MAG: tripartite tricarboxylate transporter TctB family protein [Reyranella sp.]|uniref:tripartite tricarboxylate transporter TctB family protein n=1 Tax=Reyranella sp. TaxID=1929291 RepID=UPI001ACB783C|nr:tripartite tricarboxylate transporter TctB family protein [Reyranella sp.]MBN9090913.1 tripartite tricarboxylate transporter TctB family protein [Reyranella sp.]